MSYSVFVWHEPVPSHDAGALAIWEDLLASAERRWRRPPPSPVLQAFGAHLDSWIDQHPVEGDDCPWQGSPLAEEVTGDLLEITLFTELLDVGIDIVAERAREHGLVCFDPQDGVVLTAPRAAGWGGAGAGRRRAGQ